MMRVSLVLGTGTIFAYFHSVGTLPKANDLLNSSVRDGAITSAHSFNNLADIPSGPVAFPVDNADNRLRTSSMETGVNSVELSNSVVGVGRHGLSGRGRNTEAKNLLKASALAFEVVKDESARVMVSGSEYLFDLDLKNFQNFLGFVGNVSARFLIYSRFLVLIRLLTVLR